MVYLALALLAVPASVFLWALLIEPRLILDETHFEVALPGLPKGWRDKKVALIADLQVGMIGNNLGMIRRAVRRIIELEPEVVLIAGDFIHQPPEDLPGSLRKLVELLRPLLDANIPIYGVLGNHDYGIGVSQEDGERYAKQVREGLERLGIRILDNDSEALALPGNPESLYLVGIGEHDFGHDDVETALSGLPEGAPRIVMMHNPETFKRLPPDSAPLAVAGHTHGGQVRLPFFDDRVFVTPRKSDLHVAGWVDGSGLGQRGNRLYINRGIGLSLVPMRLACPPELTLFTLRDG
jgi:uncharacterized protein